MRVPVAPYPHQYLVLSVFWVLTILISVVVSYYCFNLQFHDAIGCRISFHMLACHLFICFGEVSVQGFCLLSNQVFHFLMFILIVFKSILELLEFSFDLLLSYVLDKEASPF